ncbi:MAG: hypothetical protein P4L99_17705 [Chthoniobacter sp.]|nr:hypothetical protein [Chthoniobacter sp.]
MSRHDVAILTLRAFALYAWFQAFEYFAAGAMSVVYRMSSYLPGGLSWGGVLVSFGPAVIFLAVGIFLFVRSRELASWLLPLPSDAAAEQLPPHPLAAASVAFAVVGVAMFLYATPRALSFAIKLVQIDDPKARAAQFGLDAPQIIGVAVQLVLGFLLFLKSRTFATAWWRKQQGKPRE